MCCGRLPSEVIWAGVGGLMGVGSMKRVRAMGPEG